MPLDLSWPDPTDPGNLVPDDGWLPDPTTRLARHPYVRRLTREVVALRAANARLQALQLEMVNRDLLAARHLEPVNPAPVGVIEPANGVPTIVHVDNLRLLVNRARQEHLPTIRLLVGGTTTPQHCYALRLGPSELRERPQARALPGRNGALVVLETNAPVEVLQ